MSLKRCRVALVIRTDRPETATYRLAPIVGALTRLGTRVDLVEFEDRQAPVARDVLSGYDGLLVWADPLTDAGDRMVLDAVLRDVSSADVWVSAHPDVIDKIGTKEVLYSTRSLGWGTDTWLYATPGQFRTEFPARLGADGIRVIKTSRGNGGRGVWKVRLLDGAGTSSSATDRRVVVQHARVRDNSFTVLPLEDFMAEAEQHFGDWGGTTRLVDQAFCATITKGMVRCYLVGDRVAGFARQRPEGGTSDTIMGLPSAKTMFDRDEPQFAGLAAGVERDWVPSMCRLLDVDMCELPAVWDADFLYGEPEQGAERWVLAEINASSILPFPSAVPDMTARYAVGSIAERRNGLFTAVSRLGD